MLEISLYPEGTVGSETHQPPLVIIHMSFTDLEVLLLDSFHNQILPLSSSVLLISVNGWYWSIICQWCVLSVSMNYASKEYILLSEKTDQICYLSVPSTCNRMRQ